MFWKQVQAEVTDVDVVDVVVVFVAKFGSAARTFSPDRPGRPRCAEPDGVDVTKQGNQTDGWAARDRRHNKLLLRSHSDAAQSSGLRSTV